MILGLDPWMLVAALAVVVVGSAVQASIGFGMGLIAAPVLGLIDPAFLPAAVVIIVFPLGIGVALRDRASIDWRGVGLALLGRLPGVVLGAWVVHVVNSQAISAIVAISVLLAAVGSVTKLRFSTSDRNLVIAGMASGFAGTAAGIGGPPMALTYQNADLATLRSTLAAFFTVGSLLSFAALAVSGEVGRRQLGLSALLLPAVGVGLLMSRSTIGRIPDRFVRPVVLTVCIAAALALLAAEFL